MRKFLFLIAILLNNIVSYSQANHGKTWITGWSAHGVLFNGPNIITEAGMCTNIFFQTGSSNISDSDGNVLIISDGFNVYNNTGTLIEDGDTLVPNLLYQHLGGNTGFTQTSIFIPKDGNTYYHITPTMSDARFNDCVNTNSCYFDLLLYSVVDMNANGGLGKVTQRMIPVVQSANFRRTQMMACRHGNGKDWWLLLHEGDDADVHSFLVTKDSILDKGITQFNSPSWGIWDIRGQSTFNEDGTMYASTSHGSSTGLIFIADYDRCYGLLSNSRTIQMPLGSQHNPNDTTLTDRLSVGLCFSKNNKYLYVISYTNVYQYDLGDSSWFHVAGLDTVASAAQGYESAYMGPDGKIYIGNFGGLSKQMSRIDNPDVKGAGCNFCPRCLRLDTLFWGYVGTPPTMPNYGLGAKTCWPLNQSESGERSADWSFYPNPAFQSIIIKNAKGKKKVLYDAMGQIIYSTIKDEIEVSGFATGLYFIRCDNKSKKILIE